MNSVGKVCIADLLFANIGLAAAWRQTRADD
jgi:hypothetical protein